MSKKRVPYKRIPLYLYVKFYRYLHAKERVLVDEFEIKGKSMALRLITHPDSDLRICPETFIKYVQNKKLNASLIFNTTSIEFFDDYLHVVRFSEKNYQSIVQVFNKHAAKDRLQLNCRIRGGIKHSFEDMYNNVFENDSENNNI